MEASTRRGVIPLRVPLFVAIAGASCADATAPGGLLTERTDSAGIEVVEHRGDDVVMETREVLRFGLVDGDSDYLFDRIQDVDPGPDGSIWVVDASSSVRRYDGGGSFMNRVGAEGQGPGESAEGWGLIWMGGSTVALLDYDGSIQTFDWVGNYLGRRRAFIDRLGVVTPLAEIEDAWLFRHNRQPTSAREAAPTERWEIHRGPILADSSEVVFSLDGQPRMVVSERNGRIAWSGGSMFDGLPDLGVDGSGRVHYSDGLEYRVSIYESDGSLTRIVRRDVPRVDFDPTWLPAIEQGLIDGWIERMGQRPPEERLRQGIDAATPDGDSPRVPALDRIFVSADGSFWARRADRHPDPPARAVAAVMGYVEWYWPESWRADWWYDLYDPTGEYLGSAQVPATFTPFSVEGRRMYGVARNELDVEFVSVLEATPVG